MPSPRPLPAPQLPRLALAVLAGLAWPGLSGCSQLEELVGLDDDSSSSRRRVPVRPTRQAADRNAPIVVEGRLLAFLALEATTGRSGTDFNGDGDLKDRVPVVVDVGSGSRRELGVASEAVAILGDEVFLAVDEVVDAGDWNLDGLLDDRVLLHWSRATNRVAFVSTLAPGPGAPFVRAAERLYFNDVPPALGGAETNLVFVDGAQPLSPVRVLNADPAASPQVRLLGSDEGLVFLAADEVVAVGDQNGDGDATDEVVLALLDGTDPAALIRSVGLALESDTAPLRARSLGPNDWLVAFLVNEAAQGATNLNAPGLFPPAWQPPQCAGLGDTDADDDVLHFLTFAAWHADPLASPPTNTGLPGVDRVLAVRGPGGAPGYVATVTDEFEEGGCSLNGDLQDDGTGNLVPDQNDRVLRWVQATSPVLPETNVDLLVASRSVRGGISGVTELDDRFVIIANEFDDSRDLNGDGRTNNLLAWLDPGLGAAAQWSYDHSAGSGFFVGTQWMSVSADRTQLLLSIQETILGFPFNSGDSDAQDSVPALASFDPADPSDLDFPGPPVAVDPNDSGIVVTDRHLYYRVHECQDSRDWNRDRDTRDVVLCRSPLSDLRRVQVVTTLTQNLSQANANCNDIANPPPFVELLTEAGAAGAAYVANEARDGKDYSKDGDRTDFVVHWIRL